MGRAVRRTKSWRKSRIVIPSPNRFWYELLHFVFLVVILSIERN
jgi:hypothetical protein